MASRTVRSLGRVREVARRLYSGFLLRQTRGWLMTSAKGLETGEGRQYGTVKYFTKGKAKKGHGVIFTMNGSEIRVFEDGIRGYKPGNPRTSRALETGQRVSFQPKLDPRNPKKDVMVAVDVTLSDH
ncbi:hypothetical protein AAMO2058_001055000 [Amorphochlora amoebiformis]